MIRRVLVGIAMGGMALVGCGGDDSPATVVVVGDSITFGSAEAIRAAFADDGTQVTIDAEIGRRMVVGDGSTGGPRSGVLAMQQLLAAGTTADTWVIALGTNDVGQYGNAEEVAAIQQLLATVPADTSLVWVDTCLPGRTEQSARFDQNLTAVLADRPDTEIARWSEVCAEPGLLLPDLVHPDVAGQQAFATVIADAVGD